MTNISGNCAKKADKIVVLPQNRIVGYQCGDIESKIVERTGNIGSQALFSVIKENETLKSLCEEQQAIIEELELQLKLNDLHNMNVEINNPNENDDINYEEEFSEELTAKGYVEMGAINLELAELNK